MLGWSGQTVNGAGVACLTCSETLMRAKRDTSCQNSGNIAVGVARHDGTDQAGCKGQRGKDEVFVFFAAAASTVKEFNPTNDRISRTG